MASPIPEPTEKKRRRGTLRADRLPAPIRVLPPADLSLTPDHFGEAGARLWRTVTVHAAPWLATTDLETLRLVCEAMDRRAELVARLANDGWVLYTDKGYAYQHPAAGMLATLEDQIRKWLSLLGLTPADRSRLGVAEVKAMSKLEEMRARKAGLRSS